MGTLAMAKAPTASSRTAKPITALRRFRRVDTTPPIPGGAFNVGFQNVAPTLQQRFFVGLQSRFGVPQQDLLAEADRFRLQGLDRNSLAFGR